MKMFKFRDLNLIQSFNALDQIVKDSIRNKKKMVVNTINANILSHMYQNLAYRDKILSSSCNILDGKVVSILLTLKKMKRIRCLPGPDVFYKYVQDSRVKQVLIGGMEQDTQLIQDKYPHVQIMNIGFHEIDEFDYKSIGRRVSDEGYQIIWVSLGAPKQEDFAYRLLQRIENGLIFPVGAAFNFYGSGKRAPYIFRVFALEWFYRLITDKSDKTKARLKNELKLLTRVLWEL